MRKLADVYILAFSLSNNITEPSIANTTCCHTLSFFEITESYSAMQPFERHFYVMNIIKTKGTGKELLKIRKIYFNK